MNRQTLRNVMTSLMCNLCLGLISCYYFCIVWGITKQIVTDVIGEYLKFFPLSLEYSPRLSASGNIPNFGEIILNIHLIVSNYLYNISESEAASITDWRMHRSREAREPNQEQIPQRPTMYVGEVFLCSSTRVYCDQSCLLVGWFVTHVVISRNVQVQLSQTWYS